MYWPRKSRSVTGLPLPSSRLNGPPMAVGPEPPPLNQRNPPAPTSRSATSIPMVAYRMRVVGGRSDGLPGDAGGVDGLVVVVMPASRGDRERMGGDVANDRRKHLW